LKVGRYQNLRLRSPQRLDFGYASAFRRNGGSGEIALVRPLINLAPDPENIPSYKCFTFKERGGVARASQCEKIRGNGDGKYDG